MTDQYRSSAGSRHELTEDQHKSNVLIDPTFYDLTCSQIGKVTNMYGAFRLHKPPNFGKDIKIPNNVIDFQPSYEFGGQIQRILGIWKRDFDLDTSSNFREVSKSLDYRKLMEQDNISEKEEHSNITTKGQKLLKMMRKRII